MVGNMVYVFKDKVVLRYAQHMQQPTIFLQNKKEIKRIKLSLA